MKRAAAVLAVLAGAGAVAFWLFRSETTLVYVFAPSDSAAMLRLDDDSAVELPAGGHHVFRASEGAHSVTFSSGQRADFVISPESRAWVVPASPAQCFWVLDLSKSEYRDREWRESTEALPTVQWTFRSAFELPKGVLLPHEQLPETVKAGGLVQVLAPLPCVEFTEPTDEVLKRVLHYRSRRAELATKTTAVQRGPDGGITSKTTTLTFGDFAFDGGGVTTTTRFSCAGGICTKQVITNVPVAH
jgi:hypothetical protein